jgi:FkbM family methyltransferase
MRTASIQGKLIQLSNLPWSQWGTFIQAWMRRHRSGSVPCVFPSAQRLIHVPLEEFYESYWFFSESELGRAELGFFLARLRPNDVVFDIGAFRGVYGAAAKAVLGDAVEVHLFEPLSENLKKLQSISTLNRFRRFEVVGKAVGSGAAIKGNVDPTDSMLRGGDPSNAAAGIEFPSISIDAYVAEKGVIPSLVKIDVEGFEADLVEGAHRTLTEHKPRLWIEMHPDTLTAHGKRWQDLVDFLKSLGYATTFFEDYELPTRDKAFHVWCEA